MLNFVLQVQSGVEIRRGTHNEARDSLRKGINGVLGGMRRGEGGGERRFVLFGWESTSDSFLLERDQQARASVELNPISESKQIYQTPMVKSISC